MEYRVEHWTNKGAAELAKALNGVAEEGWRLVSVVPLNSHELYVIFEGVERDSPELMDMPGGRTTSFRRP